MANKSPLAPIADKIAKRLGDIRSEPEWENRLWDEIAWRSLDTKQCDIVFGMVARRWDQVRKASAPA